jgi:hypothetical protein
VIIIKVSTSLEVEASLPTRNHHHLLTGRQMIDLQFINSAPQVEIVPQGCGSILDLMLSNFFPERGGSAVTLPATNSLLMMSVRLIVAMLEASKQFQCLLKRHTPTTLGIIRPFDL